MLRSRVYGCGEVDYGKCDGDKGNGFLQAHGEWSFFISFLLAVLFGHLVRSPGENSFDAFDGAGFGLGHGDALPPDASGGGLKGGEKSEQGAGVVGAAGAGGERGLVTRGFGEVREMAVEPPRQRTEPEDGAMDQSNALRESVAARDMREFVGEDGIKLGVVPLAPSRRQKNGGAQSADREWHRNMFGFEKRRSRAEIRRMSAAVERKSRAGIVDALGGTQQAAGESESEQETPEQQGSDGQVEAEGNASPGDSRSVQ